MRFWDSSAIVPLCANETWSERLQSMVQQDGSVTVWWGTAVEVASGLARRRRDGTTPVEAHEQARARARALAREWSFVRPSAVVRDLAMRLLRVHALRAGDALQLAAALIWAENNPAGSEFVSLDERLREAARLEGFEVLPTLLQ